jgi:Fe-S-cluster containining protein
MSKQSPETGKPENWFQDGLRFECTQCGDCCTGEPGFVWVNVAEIEALAIRFQLSTDEFERKYVRKLGNRKSLVEFPNGDCVFLDSQTRKCSVYEDRPRQCRTWPFWDSNLRTKRDWEWTCSVCPGSGKGRVYTEEEILSRKAVIKA